MVRRPRVALIAVGLLAALTATRTRAQSDGTAQIITRSEPFTGAGALPESTAGPRLTLPSGGVPDDMVVVLDEYGPQVVDTQRAQTSPGGNGLLSNNLGLGLFGNQAGGVSTAAAGYCNANQAGALTGSQPRQYRFGVFGEALYLQAGAGANIVYAVPVDSAMMTAQPMGGLGTLDSEFQTGFRFGGILILDDLAAIIGTYARWEGDTSGQLATTAPLMIRSLVTAPGLPDTAPNSLVANAQYDIKMQTFDLDYRRELWRATNVSLDGIVGARYGQLDQTLEVSQVIGLVTTTVSTEIDFVGVGLRLGGEGELRPFGGGFLLYGRGMFDVLFGKFDSQYRQFNDMQVTQAMITFDEDRTVPIGEIELGVGYSLPVYGALARFTAGYQLSAWFNTVTTGELINSVRTSNFLDPTDTLTFDGIVGRIEVVF